MLGGVQDTEQSTTVRQKQVRLISSSSSMSLSPFSGAACLKPGDERLGVIILNSIIIVFVRFLYTIDKYCGFEHFLARALRVST